MPVLQEKALAQGEDRLKEASRAQRLDLSIDDTAEKLGVLLQSQIGMCDRAIVEATAQQTDLQVRLLALPPC